MQYKCLCPCFMSLKGRMAISLLFLPHSYIIALHTGAHPQLDNFGFRKAQMEAGTHSFQCLQIQFDQLVSWSWLASKHVHDGNTYKPTKTMVLTIPLGNCIKNFSIFRPAYQSVSPILTALTLKLLGMSGPYVISLWASSVATPSATDVLLKSCPHALSYRYGSLSSAPCTFSAWKDNFFLFLTVIVVTCVGQRKV